MCKPPSTAPPTTGGCQRTFSTIQHQVRYSRPAKESSMIKIGIVDDHAIVRSGLRQFLSEHVDLRVEGEAANGREAIDLVRNKEIDVLLMDLSCRAKAGWTRWPCCAQRRPIWAF